MNKIIIYIALILFLFPFVAYAEPFIEFDTEGKDLGDVVEGQKPEYEFAFSNNGSDELVIEKIIPT